MAPWHHGSRPFPGSLNNHFLLVVSVDDSESLQKKGCFAKDPLKNACSEIQVNVLPVPYVTLLPCQLRRQVGKGCPVF